MVDNYNEHILDGIVIEDSDGKLRFVDGPEVARTAERAVTLAITAAEAAELPPPQKAPPRFSPAVSRGGSDACSVGAGRSSKSPLCDDSHTRFTVSIPHQMG